MEAGFLLRHTQNPESSIVRCPTALPDNTPPLTKRSCDQSPLRRQETCIASNLAVPKAPCHSQKPCRYEKLAFVRNLATANNLAISETSPLPKTSPFQKPRRCQNLALGAKDGTSPPLPKPRLGCEIWNVSLGAHSATTSVYRK